MSLREDRRGVVWVEYLILIAVLALAAVGALRQLTSSVATNASEQGVALVAMSMSTVNPGNGGSPSLPAQDAPPPAPPKQQECSGWLSCAWEGVSDFASDATDFVGDYTKGVYGAVWDDLKGTWETIKDPMSVLEGIQYAIEHPQEALLAMVWDEESAAAWARGDYGTAIGRTVWNVGSNFIPGVGQAKWLAKINKLQKAAPDAPDTHKLPDDPEVDEPDLPEKPRDPRDDEEECTGDSCSCFAAGTLVQTPYGPQPIEAIAKGDLVWSRDERTGALALRPVVRLFVTHDKPIVALRLSGAAGEQTLRTTAEHPFWSLERGWVGAAALIPGEAVVALAGGVLRVEEALPTGARETVFNFEVEELHTYFVGAVGTWVHNKCGYTPDSAGALVDQSEGRMGPNQPGHAKDHVPDEDLTEDELRQWAQDHSLKPNGNTKSENTVFGSRESATRILSDILNDPANKAELDKLQPGQNYGNTITLDKPESGYSSANGAPGRDVHFDKVSWRVYKLPDGSIHLMHLSPDL